MDTVSLQRKLERLVPRAPPKLLRLMGTKVSFAIQSDVQLNNVFRNKALTPMLAGSICGGVLVLAWIVGLIWYLLKRRKRKGQYQDPSEEIDQTERYIIPPDPAILEGNMKPDEHDARLSVRQ